MSKKKLLLVTIDAIYTFMCYLLAVVLKFNWVNLMEKFSEHCITGVMFVAISIFIALLIGVYDNLSAYFGFKETIKQLIVAVSLPVIGQILKWVGLTNISTSLLLIFAALFFIVSGAVRGSVRIRRWLTIFAASRHDKNKKKVIIIGAGEVGATLGKHLFDHPEDSLFPVGYLDDDKEKIGKKIDGIKILGKISDCKQQLKLHQVDTVIVAINNMTPQLSKYIYDSVFECDKTIDVLTYEINPQASQNSPIKKVSIEDLLFRDPIITDSASTRNMIEGKVVVVTGGAGSIGSELCRQILQNKCKQLIIYDIHENGLYEINEELKHLYPNKYITCLGSVRDANRLKVIFDRYKPELVFHAAAHKHVPMVELNPFEAIKNNVLGTHNVVKQITNSDYCKKFILISTDKAVNPTNVMGASKRMCELIVKAYSNSKVEMAAVRFGNVLGSNGSVVPLFKRQIEAGGPITITDKRITRYFMTIKEAVSLVLSAGAGAKGSELFVLDMGQPIKIYDLAVNLIRLSGKIPDRDIQIVETGLRPGEKMYEELMLQNETVDHTSHEKIFTMHDKGVDKDLLCENIDHLASLLTDQNNEELLRETLFGLVKKYNEQIN